MAAPYKLGAESPVGVTCFRLEELRPEAGHGCGTDRWTRGQPE